MNLFPVTAIVPDPGGDNKQIFLYRAPTDALGGGVTVHSAVAVNGAATGAGTSFSFALHKYSAAGTPAVNGTVAAAIGGTAATIWGAGVPQEFVISSSNFLDAGESLVLDYQEDAAGNPTNATVIVWLQMGK
jgi:hypothetical protein